MATRVRQMFRCDHMISRRLRKRRRHELERRDKAIAFARHGLDESGRLTRVAQHLSDLENGRADTGVEVGEDIRAPQPLRDVIARHQFLSVLQQQEQEIHGLPRE